MGKLVAEIDAVDLGVSLFEAVVGIKRPDGLTAEQAFKTLPADDQQRVIRAAKVAIEKVSGAIQSGWNVQ